MSRQAAEATSTAHEKAPIREMLPDRKDEVMAQLTDDVLAKLTSAFFEVVSKEKWGKRDLALISGLNETAIGHILAGRRKNLTIETIAMLARAMKKRPELVLHDMRPSGNRMGLVGSVLATLEQSRPQQNHQNLSVLAIQSSSAATLLQGSSQQNAPKDSASRFLETEQARLSQTSR
jgi:hypothetical protein